MALTFSPRSAACVGLDPTTTDTTQRAFLGLYGISSNVTGGGGDGIGEGIRRRNENIHQYNYEQRLAIEKRRREDEEILLLTVSRL